MTPIPLPLRTTFLAPCLRMPPDHARDETGAATLLFVTLFEHLVRHPSVAVTDPDDGRMTDGEGRPLGIDHPDIDAIRASEFGSGHRDELLWFELSLDPAAPGPVVLRTERFDGQRKEYTDIGRGPMSRSLASCLKQWLAAHGLGEAPRPLEDFTARDFLDALDCANASLATRTPDGSMNITLPRRLQVPVLRFIYCICNLYTYDGILQVEPDNPWALRDQFLAQLHWDPPVRDLTLVRRALEAAPCFGKLYLSVFGDGVTDEEHLHAFAMASVLIPGNSFSLKDYANTLNRECRWAEAIRYAERACLVTPLMLEAHWTSMHVQDLCRYGAQLIHCGHHLKFLDPLVDQGHVAPDDPVLRNCRLRYSDALMQCGRLEEAIQVRESVLQGLEETWPQQTKVLRKWQTDPGYLAGCYAREGHHRVNPGRVLEGFAEARPDGAAELAMYIEALIQLGREDEALLAYSQHGLRQFVVNPVSRIAGATALVLGGRLAAALENVQYVNLAFPQTGWDTAIHRILRLAACRPLAEWDSAVQSHLRTGARRLARLVARDAADFVPGCGESAAVREALAGSAPFAFEPSVFARLRESLGDEDLAGIDAFLGRFTEPALDTADRLVNGWYDAVAADAAGTEGDEAAARFAPRLLWMLAGTLGRYLAMTTQPPNVLAGGYRQVAADCLEEFRGRRGTLSRQVLRGFFEGLETLALRLDPWLFDSWLLRFERALDLEAFEGSHLGPLVDGLPSVASLLRGDERVAWEFRQAWLLSKDPARRLDAMELHERCVRAIGRDAAVGWSACVPEDLPPGEALDVHLTAAFANRHYAGACVRAAKLLMARGKGAQAFEVLAAGFGAAGENWREERKRELAPLWDTARMPVPLDWNAASGKAMEALQQGNWPVAVDCTRWCLANDPKNAAAWRNLGIAYARQGNTCEALAAFARADLDTSAFWTGQALGEAGHWAEAVRAYRFGSPWFRMVQQWQAYAYAAYFADDAEAMATANRKAIETDPAAGDLKTLNALAGALDDLGDHAGTLEVARQILDKATNDPVFVSCGHHHLACALFGLGQAGEALPHAETAVRTNPLKDNQAAFAETLDRVRRNAPRTPKPTRLSTPEGVAWDKLAAGRVQEVVRLGAKPESFRLLRAALVAAEHRFQSQNDVAVTAQARQAATWTLGYTAGQTDPDAVLCRARALKIRENDLFPVDTPCPLGARLERDDFRRLYSKAAKPAAGGGTAGADDDPEVFPGTAIPRLSDYVRVIKAMQSGNPVAALGKLGIDMGTYGQLAAAWGQKMAQDPALGAAFAKRMTT